MKFKVVALVGTEEAGTLARVDERNLQSAASALVAQVTQEWRSPIDGQLIKDDVQEIVMHFIPQPGE